MSFHSFVMPRAIDAVAIRRDLNRLVDVPRAPGAADPQLPVTDAREDTEGFTLDVDLPGVAPESVEVLTADGVLSVSASRAPRALAEGEQVLFGETARGTFRRRFRLPKSADLQAVSATYAQGVLTVRIGKLAPMQPRKVTVAVG